jgi:hypothetical protein
MVMGIAFLWHTRNGMKATTAEPAADAPTTVAAAT